MKKIHRTYFAIAGLLAASSWMLVVYFWDKLPNIFPVHFGISGQADAWSEKSLFYVLLIPVTETFITILFYFLYHKPQYANFPSTLWLMALDIKHRKMAFDLMRKMLVGTLLIINFLMTYIVFGMNMSAIDSSFALSPWVMIVLVGSLLICLTYWTVVVSRATKVIIKKKEEK